MAQIGCFLVLWIALGEAHGAGWAAPIMRDPVFRSPSSVAGRFLALSRTPSGDPPTLPVDFVGDDEHRLACLLGFDLTHGWADEGPVRFFSRMAEEKGEVRGW